jgi:hypothetical protein
MSDWRSKPRAKRSPIWKMPLSEIRNHTSFASILRSLGLHVGAGNYRTLKWRIAEEGIDISHMDPNIDRSRNNRWADTLDEILVKDTPYRGGSSKVRKKMLSAGLLQNVCSVCGLGAEWHGEPIHHRLDHINGDSRDYRRDNLRMVCPNCDSQLPTFAGRNRGRSNATTG